MFAKAGLYAEMLATPNENPAGFAGRRGHT